VSYADRSSMRSSSVGELGVVGLSSSSGILVDMSMQFASARLVSGGDGIWMTGWSSDDDPSAHAGICPVSVGEMGRGGDSRELSGGSCWVVVSLDSGTWWVSDKVCRVG
jgi:hypothetical protein